MYYPFSTFPWISCRSAAKELRAISKQDIISLRQLATKLIERFEQDKQFIWTEHALALVVSGLLTLLSSWLFEWPLLLVAVVILTNTLVQFIIDEIRAFTSPAKVRFALIFAAQVEIAGTMIDELNARPNYAHTKGWRISPESDLDHLKFLCGFLIIALVMLIQELLKEVNWAVIGGVALLSAILRIVTLVFEFKSKPPDEEIDLRYLPQAHASAVVTTAGIAVGGAAGFAVVGAGYMVGDLGHVWRDTAMLLGWLCCSIYFAIGWLRTLSETRQRFQRFLELDKNCRRFQLNGAYRDTESRRDSFLRQSTRQGSLWPPSWVDLREP